MLKFSVFDTASAEQRGSRANEKRSGIICSKGDNMFIIGALVNGLAIVVGTLMGKLAHRIPEKVSVTVMQVMGLSVITLGLQMGFKSHQFLIVILSLAIGAVIGEFIDLDEKLNLLGNMIERKFQSQQNEKQAFSISQGFVTGTLIFVIGAMAIVGALDSGIRGDHSVLFTKAVMDGFISLLLTTTLGIGVIFSAVPVFLYEGIISLFATQINAVVPQDLMNSIIAEVTGVGGVLILAIGINLLEIIKIKVANLLPSILIAVVIVVVQHTYFL
ncbi:UNVERIFIED_ORG: putative membrane protein YqgA involved in biofilm formation [Bacillus sp. PvP124]|nr:putative membrane protein YqgA involved in biofilm formation [Bacillus sp. PvP124]